MKRFIKTLSICIVVLLVFGFGCSDYSEKIGKTGFTFHRTSSIGKFIWPEPSKKCAERCGFIESIDLGYEYNEHVIAAIRQIKNTYQCDENRLGTEITQQVVLEYIDLKTGMSSGSLELNKLSELGGLKIFDNIDVTRLLLLEKNRVAISELSDCTNPIPI